MGLISETPVGGKTRYHKADGLGTSRVLTNSTRATTDTLDTDAFGNTVGGRGGNTGGAPSSFGFVGGAGYQTDSDTGLMLLGRRYYDPSTGRFLSRDPAMAGYNWYAYCNNDPVNATDPTGHIAIVDDLLFWAVVLTIAFIIYEYLPSTQESNRKAIGAIGDAISIGYHKLSEAIDDIPYDDYPPAAEDITGPDDPGVTGRMRSKADPFAGHGLSEDYELRERFRLSGEYGGDPENWSARKAWDEWGREVHWRENVPDGIGPVEPKFK